MSFSPGKRIEFEREVLGRGAPLVRRATQRPRGRIVQITAIVALVAGAASVGGAYAARSGFFGTERRAITRMSTIFLEGLAQPDAARALDACAEGVDGARRIRAEERSVFGESVSDPSEGAEHQLEELRSLRSHLETQGADWNDATPFAFGGVRARVEGGAMKQPLTVLTGVIYFKSAARVFAIEISAWRCDGEFVIVDVWKGFVVGDSIGDFAAYAGDQAAELQRQATETASLAVSYLKQLYVEF